MPPDEIRQVAGRVEGEVACSQSPDRRRVPGVGGQLQQMLGSGHEGGIEAPGTPEIGAGTLLPEGTKFEVMIFV